MGSVVGVEAFWGIKAKTQGVFLGLSKVNYGGKHGFIPIANRLTNYRMSSPARCRDYLDIGSFSRRSPLAQTAKWQLQLRALFRSENPTSSTHLKSPMKRWRRSSCAEGTKPNR